MHSFDVIVLGTSPDGLATAALCAKHGFKTALFSHKNIIQKDFEAIADAIQYRWDAGIGAFSHIIELLDIKNEIKLKRPAFIDEIHLKDFAFKRKFGWLDYQYQLIELFPEEKENLKAFFSEIYDLGQEWMVLLQTGSIFSAKKMMKHRDTVYTDFVEKQFSNSKLVNLLTVDLPRINVTLTVMAGYIATQVFDCYLLQHNYANLFSIFARNIENAGGNIFLDENIGEISQNEKDNTFTIKTKKQATYTSSWIISTFDENITYATYFSELNTHKIDIKSYDPVNCITAKIKIDNTQNPVLAKQFYSGKSPLETLIHIENGYNKAQYKIRTFCNSEFLFVQGEFPHELAEEQQKESIREIVMNEFNLNSEITWITAKDIERYFGYSEGFMHRWAFRKHETPMNPFSHTTEIKNLLTTGHWGSAWFTAAVSASRFVKQNIKVFENEHQ